ncbi:sensor histidine kinase [Paenibacillus thalictri]|uniref:Sensor histidine kinase n=1 Tax=Paenibacillus thalictri TaxID=2527873 RepID=A0A4Q9DQ53_9BACL|nr:sensor histidine kinase [Paenibacillus thalictri]TBL76513.1 sensor histidine kinase [Paenibacillus thalictri]
MAFLKMNTFSKVIILVACLLAPTILLYSYSYQVSVNVVRKTVENGNDNRLTFVMSQMEMMIDQLTKFPVTVSRDYSIKQYFDGRNAGDPLALLQKQLHIADTLNIQTATSGWNNEIILYLTDSEEVLSHDYSAKFDNNYLQDAQSKLWQHRSSLVYGMYQTYFSRLFPTDIPNLLVEVRFADANIKNMLSTLKLDSQREPFLYMAGGGEPIINYTANRTLVNSVIEQLDQQQLGYTGSLNLTLQKERYIVNYIRATSLGWYLVDVVPMESIFSPIRTSRNLFYTSVALLMALSILATFLLYRNVQKPIQLLVRGVQRIKQGQYSSRLQKLPNNEFDFLFISFNEMAEQVQELIEKVYKENLRSREATLKHLQSQINPHFLYNCLSYIKSMAKLREHEAIIAMALNLGQYYRYTTRLEKSMTRLSDEIKLVDNYLKIQMLRIQRFEIEMDIPAPMLELMIPRLIIQPLVENAVIHGVENCLEYGKINIKGLSSGGLHRIVVEDTGKGMTEEKIRELERKIAQQLDEEMGCGLWNIHQRLVHFYGGRSGLLFSRSPLGGLRVELVWEEAQTLEREGDGNVSTPHR